MSENDKPKFTTAKYARMPFYVDAVRVTEENIDSVVKWCQGEKREDTEGLYIKVRVHRPLTDRQTRAYLGDWVLYAGTGYKVYTDKAFEKSFEKVTTLTKAQADQAGIRPPIEERTTTDKSKIKVGNLEAGTIIAKNFSPASMPPKKIADTQKPDKYTPVDEDPDVLALMEEIHKS